MRVTLISESDKIKSAPGHVSCEHRQGSLWNILSRGRAQGGSNGTLEQGDDPADQERSRACDPHRAVGCSVHRGPREVALR